MIARKTATVFGGSGFLGKYVTRKLAADGYAVRVACRRTDLANDLRQLGDVGQVVPFYAPVQSEADVAAAVANATVVVNLAAILGASSPTGLNAVNVDGPARVARLAAAAGVKTLVQMSAIGASSSSPSAYGRSRAAGEEEVRNHFPTASIVRASVLFGPEDHFFNMLGGLARYIPFVMPVYGAGTKLQPVYVVDVAEAIRRIIATCDAAHPVQPCLCELGGPDVVTMKTIAESVLQMTGRTKSIFEVPVALASVQAAVLERLPGRMLTRDQIKMLSVDNVVGGNFPGFHELGMTPTPMDLIVPAYMKRYAPGGGKSGKQYQYVV
ncbi:complex I NDUFA9 subunit family protein [Acetobacter conturbans]|uniref:Sugar nucleotide-binding protein n=1 Tax=Acetobacter conturbans TaxID=1737472 RepID=A0ABX0K2Q1_9PROT|nr:complex I NDUFA9 subunit family protein [Acetobacter conturbans]NHN88945.1 sugar nucleotide-binding protein [Acetobacter conturbans]